MTPDALAGLLLDQFGTPTDKATRRLIAIAGPPGAGKTTLATKLARAINQRTPVDCAIVVPMDGFHLDNPTLAAKGLLTRKGAPETFDAEAFIRLVHQLKTAGDQVRFPGFDRTIDAVIPAAGVVLPAHSRVIIEGNYLLLDRAPWDTLKHVLDFSIFLRPSEYVLEQRLTERWIQQGFDQREANQRAQHNDLPNARLVLASSTKATLELEH